MTFARRLLVAEVNGQAALMACAVLVATGYCLVGLVITRSANSAHDMASMLLLFSVGTYLYGLLPVALYGAPLYALADHLGRATWLVVLAIGWVPGTILALFAITGHSEFGFSGAVLVVGCGVFVSVVTHVLFRKAKGVPGGV
jgi:hypothetical protein